VLQVYEPLLKQNIGLRGIGGGQKEKQK
jgi:hypothetical protein